MKLGREEAGLPRKTGTWSHRVEPSITGEAGTPGLSSRLARACSHGNDQISKENAEQHFGFGAGP